ncbi:MAG: DUF115 domain-containing protein [Phycisphaerae bacterium]|jgi:hypothetical protein
MVSDSPEKPAGSRPAASPVLPSLTQRYARNLAALYRSHPALAPQIDALPFSACVPLEPTRDGHYTVRLIADDGKPVYAHSRYRPVEEASRFVEAQRRAPAEGTTEDDPGSRTYFIAGLGLGYHLEEFERQGQPRLIVAEDDLALIKAALCVADLSKPLADGRLMLLTSVDKGLFHATLRPVNADVLLGLRFVTPPQATRYHLAFQAEARRLLMDFLAFARLQMVTLLRNARITCRNIAYNLGAYLARPGVEVLAGRGAGYPAILVAAGPSLARNVEQLGALRERAVIVAVQTVYKALLARGIRPHFVTSLDFHEMSAQFFRGAGDPGDCMLVAEPKATWHVLDAFPGRTHVLSNEWYADALRERAPHRAGLRAGSTVAHLAFYLAEHLGCDPIILVGQDLSFTEGLYYPAGMPIEQVWAPEMGRFDTIEMKQWERIVRMRASLRLVKDIHGRDVYTDDQMFTYAEQFQSDFAGSRARIIHASEGGMRLAGTEVMTLREAAERYCTRPLPAELFAAGGEPAPVTPREQAAAALAERAAEVAKLKKIAVEMRGLLEKLVGLLDRPDEFNRVVVRVDDLRMEIQQYDRTYKMVVGVSQAAELRRYSADRRIGEKERETPETARRRLLRDREFVEAFIDGCTYLADLLPEALARLERKPA